MSNVIAFPGSHNPAAEVGQWIASIQTLINKTGDEVRTAKNGPQIATAFAFLRNHWNSSKAVPLTYLEGAKTQAGGELYRTLVGANEVIDDGEAWEMAASVDRTRRLVEGNLRAATAILRIAAKHVTSMARNGGRA